MFLSEKALRREGGHRGEEESSGGDGDHGNVQGEVGKSWSGRQTSLSAAVSGKIAHQQSSLLLAALALASTCCATALLC